MAAKTALTPGTAKALKHRKWGSGEIKRHLAFLTMLLPGCVFLFCFSYMPMPAIILAFKRYQLAKPPKDYWIQNKFIYSLFVKNEWVGFSNFKFIFNTPDAWMVIRNTLGYNLVFMALGLVLSVGFAFAVNELKKMQKDFGITTIYVTHDQEEALTLSDRIAVFNKGVIEQIGTPNEVYNHSATEFVCNFIGDINRVEAPIAAKMKLAAGQNHFIRLERLHVNKPKRDDEILIDGVVENIEYYGLYIKYYIDVGSQILKAIEKNDGINIYAPGEKVTVAMKPTDVMSYDAQ